MSTTPPNIFLEANRLRHPALPSNCSLDALFTLEHPVSKAVAQENRSTPHV
jgi:hypothetical protein